MKNKLPAPYPDPIAHQLVLERGLKRFPKRRENYELYKKALRGLEVDSLPIMMDIEPVSRCNFRCGMCQVSKWPGGKRSNDLTFSEFKQLLEELCGLVEIKLQGLGEPLLNLHIFDMIALAYENDIWTRLTINGSLLNFKNNYQKLFDSNPGEIQISIDGATKKVFENIRKGSDFEAVVKNVTKLNKYRQNKGRLKTRSWTLVQKANEHQLKDIIRLGAKMEFKRMTFSLAISYFGTNEWKAKNSCIEVYSNFNRELAEDMITFGKTHGIEITFWDGSAKYEISGNPKKLCSWLWERAFISSDLRVVPCCVISNPDIIDLGSAHEFSKIWNSKIYLNMRKKHLNGNIPDYCKQCYI